MAVTADEPSYAHPMEQARLGHQLESALHMLADTVELAQVDDLEDGRSSALSLTQLATRKLSYLADRKEQVGPLCSPLEKEFRTAESIILALKSLSLMCASSDGKSPHAASDEPQATMQPRMPLSECIPSMVRIAKLIRQRFPTGTAKRWRETARAGAETEPPRRRMVL